MSEAAVSHGNSTWWSKCKELVMKHKIYLIVVVLIIVCVGVGLGVGLGVDFSPKKKQVGDCTNNTECDVGFNCDNEKKCVAAPLKKLGESCASVECVPGLNCNATSKTCVNSSSMPSKKLGEICATGECAAGLNCNTTSKTCVSLSSSSGGITFLPIPSELNASSTAAREVIKKVNDQTATSINVGLGVMGVKFTILRAWYFKEEYEANNQKYHCTLVFFKDTPTIFKTAVGQTNKHFF